jgi:predicted peptidase
MSPHPRATQVEVRDGKVYPYLVHVPKDVPDDGLPLLLYLHGAGESGRRLKADLISPGQTGTPMVQLERGIASELLSTRFVTVSPQTDRGWSTADLDRFTQQLLEDPRLPLDPSRLYVTGVSMGGGGTYAAAATGRFAAAAPVCPARRDGPWIQQVIDTPMWVFHGANDRVISVQHSDRVVASLREQSTREVIYTRYPESPAPVSLPHLTGHASWMQAYADDAIWTWFLDKPARTSP